MPLFLFRRCYAPYTQSRFRHAGFRQLWITLFADVARCLPLTPLRFFAITPASAAVITFAFHAFAAAADCHAEALPLLPLH